MNYVKLFFVAISIVSALRDVILPLKPFNRAKALELFGKAYELLPTNPVSKDEFIRSIDKWIDLYIFVVNSLWYISPELCHKLAWSVVKAEQSGWLYIVENLQKYLKGYIVFDDEINQKVNSYIHAYNLKILDALLDKDFEIQRKQIDEWFDKTVEVAVEKIKEKLNKEVGEPPGGWIIYIDRTGMYINGQKMEDIEKWTGIKLS